MTLAAAKAAFPVGASVESTYPGTTGEKGKVVGHGSIVTSDGLKTPTLAVVLVEMEDENTLAFAPMFLTTQEG